jgi:phospholipase C
MSSRREFLKKAIFMAAAGGVFAGFPGSIEKALAAPIDRATAIDPIPGSSYLDAEHIVILMQENRSFDHAFGSLRGVRGYNDPRIILLPNGNPVWLQTNAAGETYAPFRFNIKKTKATWMGSLPHGWIDQGQARNDGRHDLWLEAKASTTPEYARLPLTMGYYTREDIPFYYALADAFTLCDQNFCSSLTPTEPNRLYMWTGTVRAKKSIDSYAHVRNADMGYDKQLSWETFPERLEKNDISWRIYQNEISLPSGLTDEEDDWLSNFDDNTLEYFTQYQVRFARTHREYLRNRAKEIAGKLEHLEGLEAGHAIDPQAATKEKSLLLAERQDVQNHLETWTEEAFEKLPSEQKNLHRKAFATNEGDPHYRQLTSISYGEGGFDHVMKVPKGDVFYQFRRDVLTGNLPRVSWIVAPENFSDHPSSAWYGAWYVSEALDILTQDPEVWKKTIFILCYDENDGYFDHVPPFVPPDPQKENAGKVSWGIDPWAEYVSAAEEDEIRTRHPEWQGRPGPIGLGFRVPLVIASPWSRGGYVNSQVFDHTSMLQFLEKFLSHKTGKPIRESNITEWRRTVSGDLTSTFRRFDVEKKGLPEPVKRDSFFVSINEAQYMPTPDDFHRLSREEIDGIRDELRHSSWLPRQETGVRPACALPYELEVDGSLEPARRAFVMSLAANNELFGEEAAGAPFRVYSLGRLEKRNVELPAFESFHVRDYAVASGDRLSDEWPLKDFSGGVYHLTVHGPNGFYREFRGSMNDPSLTVYLKPEIINGKATGNADLHFTNHTHHHPLAVVVDDLTAGGKQQVVKLPPGGGLRARKKLTISLSQTHSWYDLRVHVDGAPHYEQRFAGHIETGGESYSDPAMA